MLLLGNIGLGFFLTNLLHTYIVIILARQGYTFDMSIHNIKSLGIPKRSLLKMLSHFSSSICVIEQKCGQTLARVRVSQT